ncbi:hypothetical protein PsAD2_01694 [Pseudovibrio axinellae]|uniref:Uncharacterized protein n=1 Tax=Pseudovibrio axinellae TaxID=989403 RepID=A0A165ZGG4_9HYPH|nr:hypothetical protein [Pseudovibrio axinellae]KZL19872.1 hypothetical protein PsAD2_01694 [Pseudovibrio axinellae]SER38600.1 hypothetical protein SAMN05421798_10970 [Pseudovibrio axinellae]
MQSGHTLSTLVVALLCLSGCISEEERLPQAFTPEIAIPFGATLVTVNTTPDGAFCYLSGYRSSIFVQHTPGPMVVPEGFEKTSLICELEGFKTTRGAVLPGPPPPDGEKIIIQRVFIPVGVDDPNSGPAGALIPDGFVGTYRR